MYGLKSARERSLSDVICWECITYGECYCEQPLIAVTIGIGFSRSCAETQRKNLVIVRLNLNIARSWEYCYIVEKLARYLSPFVSNLST